MHWLSPEILSKLPAEERDDPCLQTVKGRAGGPEAWAFQCIVKAADEVI